MGNDALNPNKIGVAIYCSNCGHMKKPLGRSEPMGSTFCDQECRGYYQNPQVGSLWPNESEAEFGYVVQNAGTRIKD